MRSIKAKFSSPRRQDNLVNEFFALQKGNITIDEYTKRFTDMLPFLRNTLPNEEERVNRYHYLDGLPGDYSLKVGKATILDEVIKVDSKVEDMILIRQVRDN